MYRLERKCKTWLSSLHPNFKPKSSNLCPRLKVPVIGTGLERNAALSERTTAATTTTTTAASAKAALGRVDADERHFQPQSQHA
mmetsp:Transcript_56963/g.124600  ORF Transcript_56963/g.124600 Transcript_56963/m.124600 type:complete len:84 (+) Transcript_56963:1253-1504(+)